MRIGYILSMQKGLPAFTYREVKGLRRLGNDVFLYIMRNGKGPYLPDDDWPIRKWMSVSFLVDIAIETLHSPLISIALLSIAIRSNTLVDLFIAYCFAKQMRSDKLDSLLCFEGLHGLRIGYYCYRLTKIPITVIVHAEMLRIRSRRKFTRIALLACKKIISPTKLNCDRIEEEFQIPQDKIVLNRMAIDTQAFRPDHRFKVLITGFFADRKGHETLLRAIKYLNRDDIVVWIVGGDVWGGESFDVEGFIQKHRLGKKVVMFGRVSDPVLHSLIDASDIFCLPCRTPPSGIVEGLPVSIMEAMAYKKPVISTKHTGIPELVSEILVEENDFIGIAKAILKLKNEPVLRQKLGAANQKIIELKFGPKNIESLAEILKEG